MRTSLTALLLLLAACGAEEALIRPQPRLSCEADTECAADARCHAGLCVPAAAERVAVVDVEVRPAPATGLAPTPFLEEVFLGGSAVHALPRPVRYQEIIVYDGAGRSIDARVVFTGQRRIPARESNGPLHLAAMKTVGTALLPDAYEVRVLPDSEALAPLLFSGWVVRPTDDVTRREFQLPMTYRSLRGVVASRTQGSVRIPRVRVEARGLDTGLGSPAAWSDEYGEYTLSLPETADVAFEIRAQLPGQVRWGYADRVSLGAERQRVLNIALEDDQPALHGHAELDVFGTTADGPVPLKGALVTLTASSAHPSRQLVIEGRSDAKGRVHPLSNLDGDLELLAAKYVVQVGAPASGTYGAATFTLDLRELGPGVVLQRQLLVPAKQTIRGNLASALGRPIPGATLRFEADDGTAPSLDSVITEADGSFEARLVLGTHVLVVTPPLGAIGDEALAPAVFELRVDAGTTDVGLFNLAPARSVTGEVRAEETGLPLVGADVELFARVRGRAVSFAHAVTDAQGRYRALLPLRW